MTVAQSQRRTRLPRRIGGKRGRASSQFADPEPVLRGGIYVYALLLVAGMGLCSCLAVYYHLLQVESGQGFKGGSGSGSANHYLRGDKLSGLVGSPPSAKPVTSGLTHSSPVSAVAPHTTHPTQPTKPNRPAQPSQPAQAAQPAPSATSQPPPLQSQTTPDSSGCTWTLHENAFLGEFADGKGSESDLEMARRNCVDLQDSCMGVTCTKAGVVCSARRGTPYLQNSPSGEVSYTKHCKGSGLPPASVLEVVSNRTFPGGFPLTRKASQAAQTAADHTGDPSRQPLAPGRAILVVIAHNQPECLTKCLSSVQAQPKSDLDAFALAVSLDDPGSFQKMESVVEEHRAQLKVEVWHKNPSSCTVRVCTQAVTKISEHFRFALGMAFARFEFGVFLENDLTVSPDFLWYFRVTAPLLDEDPTLFCASAWNDNGFKGLVSDERRLFRTDYFPGLGWMIHNRTWSQVRDIWPRFPSTGWDHWLRHGSGLQPRECVVPEVPRTHHFGLHGANVKKGSALARQLDNMIQSSLPTKHLGNLSYLLHDTYEAELKELLRGAPLVHQGSADQQAARLRPGQLLVVPYTRESYKELAKRLKISATQPRTAHHGVVLTRHEQSQVVLALVDRRQASELLPEAEQWRPHPKRMVYKGEPGESCDKVCVRLNLRCDPIELENANTCAELKRFFPCEDGCGHQVGQEIPAYVHDRSRDTARQCLVTDDAIPSCTAHVPATTRLCVCVPP